MFWAACGVWERSNLPRPKPTFLQMSYRDCTQTIDMSGRKSGSNFKICPTWDCCITLAGTIGAYRSVPAHPNTFSSPRRAKACRGGQSRPRCRRRAVLEHLDAVEDGLDVGARGEPGPILANWPESPAPSIVLPPAQFRFFATFSGSPIAACCYGTTDEFHQREKLSRSPSG